MDEDLEQVLAALGLLAHVRAGELQCHSCGVILTLRNIGLLIPQSDKSIVILCHDPNCVSVGRSTQVAMERPDR